MAVKALGRRLSEAELNAPDLDEGELDVEHYPLPDGRDIADPRLRAPWEEAVRLLGESGAAVAESKGMVAPNVASLSVASLTESLELTLLEAGFTGVIKDKLGRTYHYVDGRRVSGEKAKAAGVTAETHPPKDAAKAKAALKAITSRGDVTDQHFADLAEHLPAMSVSDLRLAKAMLMDRIAAPDKEAMVERVRSAARRMAEESAANAKAHEEKMAGAAPEAPAAAASGTEKQPHEMTKDEVDAVSTDALIQSKAGQEIEARIKAAPSFKALQAAVDAAMVRIFGKEDAAKRNAKREPNDYLGHVEMNAKSELSKKLDALQRAVFKEAGVPIAAAGTFRGHKVDWHRAIVADAIAAGKPVPPEVLADYPDLAAKYGKTGSPATAPPATAGDVADAAQRVKGAAPGPERDAALDDLERVRASHRAGAETAKTASAPAAVPAPSPTSHAAAISTLYSRAGDLAVPISDVNAQLSRLDALAPADLKAVAKGIELIPLRKWNAGQLRQAIKQRVLDRRSAAQRAKMIDDGGTATSGAANGGT